MIYFFPQQHTTPVTASVLVYHCYLGVNCESVKKRCGLPSAYYVIASLPNRELISDAQPLFFFRPSCSSHCELPSWRRDNADLQLRDSPSAVSAGPCCVSSSSVAMSLCRVVLVQSCVAGAVSHRESPREGGTWAAGQCWCLCNGPWVAAGSLRLLSLHYIAARIVEVKGKWMAWSCLRDAPAKVGALLMRGGGGEVCLRDVCGAVGAMGVFWSQFILVGGEAEVWEMEVGLGWGTPSLCFWQGHYCVWMKLSWKKVSQREAQRKACVECA